MKGMLGSYAVGPLAVVIVAVAWVAVQTAWKRLSISFDEHILEQERFC